MPFLAAIAAALGLAAAPADAGTGAGYVLLFGDSLAYNAANEYRAIAGPAPYFDFRPHSALQHHEPSITWYANNIPGQIRVMVLALGTNDATLPVHSPPVWDRVFDLLDAKGICTVVLDHRLTRPVDHEWAANMETVYAEHPNIKRLPWRDSADAHPEWHLADGIHHTQAGENNYAFALWLATEMCP